MNYARLPTMPKLTDAATLKRDAKRDLAAELRESLAQMKRGEIGRVWVNDGNGLMRESIVAKARLSMKLSQSEFAKLLGVSVRTLQQWEQGRREPTGAAQTLIKVAIHQPNALRKAVAA
jgi:putative transcriptional regulator